MSSLANSYGLSGRITQAMPLLDTYVGMHEMGVLNPGVYTITEWKRDLATGLGNLAILQLATGALRESESNLRRRIELCREIEDIFKEAVGHRELGRLLAYRGAWEESVQAHNKGVFLARQIRNQQIECVIAAYSVQRALLMDNPISALTEAQKAQELANIPFPGIGKLPRDLLRADWLLGAAHRANRNLLEADQHLTEALTRCRSINAIDTEADILLELAKLRAAQGQREEALNLAQEALTITERSGYVLQGADVNLFLAQMVLQAGDKQLALKHAREARKLATCDGPPDYTYKVAYDAAGRLLAELGAPPQD
jgi:tetratricopeptide (TPR) repeat protein